jgi:hypothetical protein
MVTLLVTLPKTGIQVICYVLRKEIFEIGLLPAWNSAEFHELPDSTINSHEKNHRRLGFGFDR